jgi:hypothetical protein
MNYFERHGIATNYSPLKVLEDMFSNPILSKDKCASKQLRQHAPFVLSAGPRFIVVKVPNEEELGTSNSGMPRQTTANAAAWLATRNNAADFKTVHICFHSGGEVFTYEPIAAILGSHAHFTCIAKDTTDSLWRVASGVAELCGNNGHPNQHGSPVLHSSNTYQHAKFYVALVYMLQKIHNN